MFSPSYPVEVSSGLPRDQTASLAQVARQVAPAIDRTLPVAPTLAGLLPGGLQRGITVSVSGVGARSLALVLISTATAAGSWAAVVGDRDLGLVSAAQAGVDLRRLVMVEAPPPDMWGEVVALLVADIDLVLIFPHHRVSGTVIRRLAARCRERGSILVRVGGGLWFDQCDLRLTVISNTWSGIDDGCGYLRSRQVEVKVDGRGARTRSRQFGLPLPGPENKATAIG